MAELMVVGVGVATADAELRFVGESKAAVCSVNLAFNRSFKNRKTDKWEQEATFMRVQVWGNRAEKMGELVKKGQPLYVTGYLKQDNWEDDKKMKRIAFTINARDFQLVVKNGKKKNDDQSSAETATSQTSPPSVSDNEIPF